MKRKTGTKPPAKKQYAFYRSNLESIVWDPAKNAPFADFSGGKFVTDKLAVAKKLRELGYPEIPVNADTPPDIVVNQPNPAALADGAHVPVLSSNISEVQGQNRIQAGVKTKVPETRE